MQTFDLAIRTRPTEKQEDVFLQASRVIAFFKALVDGKPRDKTPWLTFQLVEGELDKILRTIQQDQSLHDLYNYNIGCVSRVRFTALPAC